jgi:hypothetical protein
MRPAPHQPATQHPPASPRSTRRPPVRLQPSPMHPEDQQLCVKEVLPQVPLPGQVNLRVIARKARPEASRTERRSSASSGRSVAQVWDT